MVRTRLTTACVPLGVMATALLMGCGEGAAPRQASIDIDTINGVVEVSNHGNGAWTPQTRWRAREVFRFGGQAQPVEHLFTSQLLATALGPQGNVHVLDHMRGSISVFSKDGQLVREVGRSGRGPSDLGTPTGMTWSGDGRMWVSDPGNSKYVVFDTTGQFLETHPRSRLAYPRRMYPLVHDESVGIIDEASKAGSLIFLRTTVDGEIHDTLMIVRREPGPSRELMGAAARSRDPEFVRVGRHYVSRMKWALDPEGSIWTGSPEELRFVKRNWNGDTLMVVTADHRTSQLTSEDERLIADAMDQSGLDRSEINPIRPLFQALHVVDGGYLLVQLVETPGVASPLFDVYDPSGRYLGELDLGFAPDPLGALGSDGDLVVAPMLGDLDVPYVVGVQLIRPADG